MFKIGLIAIIGLGCLTVVWFTISIGISPMPSSAKAKRAMLQASEAADDGPIIDLGCGWGGVLFGLARKYPERQVIGYELSWLPWLYAYLYKSLCRLDNVEIHRQNFLIADISEASLLVCYLFPQAMIDMQKKLAEEKCANTLLISNTFALPAYEASKIMRLNDLYKSPIYIYSGFQNPEYKSMR